MLFGPGQGGQAYGRKDPTPSCPGVPAGCACWLYAWPASGRTSEATVAEGRSAQHPPVR